MAGYDVSVSKELLPGLLSGQDGLAKLVEVVLNQILEAQVSESLGADRHERSEERQGYRNGYRPRTLFTRVGPVTLQVPQTRDGSFSTDIFKRYQRSEQAFVLALMEMVVQGVSTRKVSTITEELCGASFCKSTVSALCAGLDARVRAFNERRLDGDYPFILVDALFIKSREDDRVVHRAVIEVVAGGVHRRIGAGGRKLHGSHLRAAGKRGHRAERQCGKIRGAWLHRAVSWNSSVRNRDSTSGIQPADVIGRAERFRAWRRSSTDTNKILAFINRKAAQAASGRHHAKTASGVLRCAPCVARGYIW